MKKQPKRRPKKQLTITTIIILALAIVSYAIVHTYEKTTLVNNTSNRPVVTGATSKPSQHNPTATNSTGQGGVVDTNGQTQGTLPSSSDWTSSSTGNITLQQPISDSNVSSGDTISGLAKVNNVQFILTDNSVGLIAQGNLSVVNGEFSGKLEFTPHSGSGKLEVYYPNSETGAEEDIIDIDVNFNT